MIEDGIRGQSPAYYSQIETHMAEVRAALAASPPNSRAISTELSELHDQDEQFIGRFGSGSGTAQASPGAAPAASGATLASVLGQLNQVQRDIQAHQAAAAEVALQGVLHTWPSVEGLVAAKSQTTYEAVENDMASAGGALQSTPPNLAAARQAVSDMQSRLSVYAQGPVQYGILDAAIIILREGFEALLVFTALLAFLKRSGNGAKQGWVWAGGGAGLAASAAIAVVITLAFAQAGGSSREVLEGATGLAAAAMLIWMLFWLHSKSNVSAWNRYISEQSSRALAANSLVSLALIAFLAVLREGAETVLFYIGIAPGITTANLLIGLGLGAGALILVAVLMLVLGVRIPIRPFFLLTSALVFFLAFKFAGMGVHSLQIAGLLQAHPLSFIPSIDLLGVFPSLETCLMQLAVLVAIAAGLTWNTRRQHSRARVEASA
ncbi:MAG: FTR1 family iron permease, partial [Chloroflexota bacterium]